MRPDNPIGEPFIVLDIVDSTNNYAMRQAQAHLAGHGAAWFAHTQTGGKGQRGKQWKSLPGENIILSTIVQPNSLCETYPFLLSATVALACYDFFSAYAGDETSIKWPNDIYWRNRKAGGILIENVWQAGKWKYAIIGIGININQTTFPENLPNPVSLKQITGKTFDAAELARELCRQLQNRWSDLLSGYDEGIMQAYNNILFRKDEKALLKKENAIIEALILGVNNKGELMIDTGETTYIPFGEVEWIVA